MKLTPAGYRTTTGPALCRAVLAAALLVVAAVSGCAGPRHYQASRCPPELMAAPVQNAQTVDLSRFAGPPVNSQRIEPGDVLEVSITAGLGADATTTFPVRVADDGYVFLSEIGRLPLAGLELMGAEQTIAAASVQQGLYRQPQVTVTMKQQGLNCVTVVGAVKEPGVKELPRSSSHLMSALVAAGGLDEDAGTQVEIRRPVRSPGSGRARLASYDAGIEPTASALSGGRAGSPQTHVEVARLDLAGEVSLGPSGSYLEDGAVVRVERRHPEAVQVIGLVRKPGQYDFPVSHELRVFGAIAMAGGLSQQVADKVYVIRKTGDGEEDSVVIEVSLQRAKRHAAENLRLAPGDIVSVEQTPLTVLMEAINIIRFGVGTSIPFN